MHAYKNFVVVWTLIYLSIAFIGRFTSSNKEYFPFFRWSLYSKTPNFIETPSVLITKYDDEIFSTPINVLELKAKYNISRVDMNLNVTNFYNQYKNNPDDLQSLKTTAFLKSLPDGSEFKLMLGVLNLSEKDLKTKDIKQVLVFKNNNFYAPER